MASSKLFLHDHPVSSYAQKIRIALREKDIPFDAKTPEGLGSGKSTDLEAANQRVEVPALVDGDFTIFDSTAILGYLEDKFPEKTLLPRDAKDRATARMIEEICDTAYEACNWVFGEVAWSKRADGELAEKLKKQVGHQTATIQAWLSEKLGDQQYFNGNEFGYADICVAPYVNRSAHYGFKPAEGSSLERWLADIRERPSVKTTFAEMEAAANIMSERMADIFLNGPNKRQYRDHRLECMIKSGGLEVVLEGLKRGNIRFSDWPPAAL